MDSIERNHEAAETSGDGNHAPQTAGNQPAHRTLLLADKASAPTPIPGDRAEGNAKPAAEAPSRRRVIVGIILALMVIGGLTLGFLPRWHQRKVAKADMSQLAIPSVSVVSPVMGTNAGGLVLPAEIKPWLEASIYARANGYLKSWVADIGAHVKAGQLLATIETPDLDQQLAQARAELVLAEANLHLAQVTDDRWKALLKTASVSEQAAAEKAAARETATASVEASRANVRRLEELVSFQRVVAPFAGTVTLRAVDVGDLIVAGSGGKELFHIAQPDKLRVYVRVPEPLAPGIAPGQTATLTTPASPDRAFAAKVTTTSEAISAISRTLLVQLEVDNPEHQILPYSFGEVTLENKTGPALTLPSNTLLFRAQGLQVGVVGPAGTVELRPVQVGRDFGQTIEIRGGVTPADRVIINPTDSLVSGIKVRVQDAPNAMAAK